MTMQKNVSPSELVFPEEQSGFHVGNDPGFTLTDFLEFFRVWKNIIIGTAITVVVLVGIIVCDDDATLFGDGRRHARRTEEQR